MTPRRPSFALTLCLLLAACGGGNPADAGDTATPDARDAAADVAADAALDVPTDSAPDAPADAALDATPDAPADAAPEATPDATPDALADAAPDARDGGLAEGERCTTSPECAPGLLCCYPCGIPGCQNVCTVPEPGTMRCPIRP